MAKQHDDWMHPQRMPRYEYKRPDPRETRFLIVRQKAAEPCSFYGSPPRPTWHEWEAFATREERDAKLAKLRETTEWSLRPAMRDILGHGWDFENEELARLLYLHENFDLVPKKRRGKAKTPSATE